MIMDDFQFLKQDDINELTNVRQIFVLYWWAATDIYMVCDKNNGCELPEYLAHKICGIYLNTKGVACVGNKE